MNARHASTSDEIKALVALAAQATITIENSRLFDRIRERDRLAALGEMAAGLAHEIRNPLGAIKGAAQLLNEADHDRSTYLDVIIDEVNRLNGVVGQFLTYARPLKTTGELVDVNHVLQRTLTLVNDVTAVKTKERESRDAQECYALVPLSSNEGLWAMDLRIDHFYISPRVLSIISSLSDPASFRQEDWVAAIHPEDVHKYQVGWQEDLDGVSRIFDLEYSVLHGNGEQRWISDRALVWRGLGPVRA